MLFPAYQFIVMKMCNYLFTGKVCLQNLEEYAGNIYWSANILAEPFLKIGVTFAVLQCVRDLS